MENKETIIRIVTGIIENIGSNPDSLPAHQAAWKLRIIRGKLNSLLELLGQQPIMEKLFENVGGNSFKLIKEIEDEPETDENALYVEYIRDIPNEKPFILRTPSGKEKFQYVMAKYPSGKEDIAVYAFRGDLVYGYNTFRKRYNLP